MYTDIRYEEADNRIEWATPDPPNLQRTAACKRSVEEDLGNMKLATDSSQPQLTMTQMMAQGPAAVASAEDLMSPWPRSPPPALPPLP